LKSIRQNNQLPIIKKTKNSKYLASQLHSDFIKAIRIRNVF
jgi:hypothetical protein